MKGVLFIIIDYDTQVKIKEFETYEKGVEYCIDYLKAPTRKNKKSIRWDVELYEFDDDSDEQFLSRLAPLGFTDPAWLGFTSSLMGIQSFVLKEVK